MDNAQNLTWSFLFTRRLDWPVDIGIASSCILGYVFAWIGLACFFYLGHRVAGMIGALAGGLVGWLWFCLVVKNRTILKGYQ